MAFVAAHGEIPGRPRKAGNYACPAPSGSAVLDHNGGMCGRYVMARSTGDLVASFDVDESYVEEIQPSYNVAPTDEVPLIIDRRGPDGDGVSRKLIMARRGLVPPWAKDLCSGARLINARMETVTKNPRSERRRQKSAGCSLPMGTLNGKRPRTAKYRLICTANAKRCWPSRLFENWPDLALPEDHPEKYAGGPAPSSPPKLPIRWVHIHDRTPLIVPTDLYSDWLDPETTSEADVQQLLGAMPEPHLVPRRVSSKVNNVRNNGPDLIDEAALSAGSAVRRSDFTTAVLSPFA